MLFDFRDCTIVTTLDTFTSLLSGIIIFGILGNLAYESNTSDIRSVVEGGPGLAFISYPDAIAKFKFVPQVGFDKHQSSLEQKYLHDIS